MYLTKVRPNIYRRPVFVNNNFDQLFNALVRPATVATPTMPAVSPSRPAVNVIEAEDHFRIDIAAPGFNKEDFNINVEKDTLTIAAKKEQTTENNEKYTRREFQYVEFKRSFHLPEIVEIENIKATMNNGILSLTLAKKEEAKELPPRKIEVA